MKTLAWTHIHWAWARYGWIGAMGLVLCLLAPAMVWWGANPEREATAVLQHQRGQQQQRAVAAAAVTTEQDPVAAFRGNLPPAGDAVQVLKSLHALARQHGLQLLAGDYKLQTDGATPWQRYQINLPVVGPYNAVKAWATEALQTHPTLALEAWQTSRDKVDQGVVQARLRWTLYLGATTADAMATALPATGSQGQTPAAGTLRLFASHSWQPPPPPPPPAVAPPTPQAPALPFRYMGRLEEDGRIAVFLQETGQPHPKVVRLGERWGHYRVDEITPEGMRLTYLPLNETQRLLFGSAP